MDYGPYEQIVVSVEEAILTLTLNRPEKLNAFTGRMMHEMIDVFTKVNSDDDVRAIVVTGAGRAFCAGADLSGGADTFDASRNPARAERDAGPAESVDWSDERVRDGGGRLTLAIFECLKPVIAAVNGPAVGVGVTMQLAMDIRIASEAARFGFVFAQTRDHSGSRFQLVPAEDRRNQSGARMVLFRPRVRRTGSAARRPGERGGECRCLLSRAHALAAEIRDNTAPVSIALIRQMMWRLSALDHPMEAHKIDSRGIYARGQSPDVREGVSAFLQKRPANFPQRVSTDMPRYFPWWEERPYS